MTVLIVDDETDLRELLREAFSDEGFHVEVAENGVEAMEQLARMSEPCVVILDLVMPLMDGNEVWNAMQQDERLAGFPVLITTSDPSRAPRGVLTMRKPVDLDVLFDTVRMLGERA